MRRRIGAGRRGSPPAAGVLGDDAVITDRAAAAHLRVRRARALPGHARRWSSCRRRPTQVAAVVRACAEHGVPFVARGSGTGLSGGALPHADGVLIVTSRMRAILEVDRDNQRAVVEPGVINLDVTRAAAPHGYYYAPDPSSQQICSIGGNVAENSGGAHCLKYGFTTNHVLGVELVTPEGDLVAARRQGAGRARATTCSARSSAPRARSASPPRSTVRLTRPPEAVRTLLAGVRRHRRRPARRSSAIIGAGIVPAAIEMMDALAIEAAEAAVHCGYPDGAGAVLIVELDGAGGRGRARSSPRSSGCCQRERRVRDPARRRRRRAGADLEGPQVGVRRGRAGSAPTTSSRTASSRGPRCPRCCAAIAELSARAGRPGGQRLPRRRRQPAPAGALRRRASRAQAERGRGGLRRDPRPLHRARRLDHRRARRRHGQGEVHAADVHRRRPRHHAAGALRLRPATASPTPARCSPPRGCAARCPAGTRARTRSQEAGLAEVF